MAAKKGAEASKGGESHTPDPPAVTPATGAELPSNRGENRGQEAGTKPQADGAAPVFAPGTNSHTGVVHRRGPDRKPRQIGRLMLAFALRTTEQQNGGPPVSGADAMVLGLRKIMGKPDHQHFMRVFDAITERYDDASDSGSGRTTIFMFPSEVEAEMKAAGQPQPAGERKVPDAPPGPLSGMVELEGPNT